MTTTVEPVTKRKTDKTEQEAKKTKPRRARDLGKVRLLTVEISPALLAALESYEGRERRTRRASVEMALERFLTEAGLWPPPS